MSPSPHILVVDDDREIRDLLARFLVKHGYRVSTAADGREMKRALEDRGIDLVVLDLMMPGEDGLTLCRDLRGGGESWRSEMPVIMLTALGEETDRIIGLEIGADDYVPKPFNPRELLARIKAVLRRVAAREGGAGSADTRSIHRFGGWAFDPEGRELTSPGGDIVTLSGGEFELLQAFVTHPRRVLSRERLLDLARGRDVAPFDRSIDVQVSRLRRKLEDDPKAPEIIKTVRGGGYIFAPEVILDAEGEGG